MSFPHVFLNNEPFPRHVNLNKDPPPQHLRIQCVRNTLYRWQGLRLQEPQILKAAWRARRTDNCPQGSFENGSSSEGKAEHTALQRLPTSRGDCPPPHSDQARLPHRLPSPATNPEDASRQPRSRQGCKSTFTRQAQALTATASLHPGNFTAFTNTDGS